LSHYVICLDNHLDGYLPAVAETCYRQFSDYPFDSLTSRQEENASCAVCTVEIEKSSGLQNPGFAELNGFWCILDGRINNLLDLVSIHENHPGSSAPEVLLKLYHTYGSGIFGKLKGRFAVLIAEPESKFLLLYRSKLGEVPLYYHANSDFIVASSEPRGIISHPEVSCFLDNLFLSDWFSLKMEQPAGHTAFDAVNELLPGECFIWNKGEQKKWRNTLDVGKSVIRYESDVDYADHYLDIMNRAIARCLPDSGNVGVMLSSGLDSAPAAAIAARQLREQGRQLNAYSWALPGFQDANESNQIKQVAEFAGIKLGLHPASHLWPLHNRNNLFITVNTPGSNAFQSLKDLVLSEAVRDGCKVILNGWFGDRLYMFSKRQLIFDAVSAGQYSIAVAELFHWLKVNGWHKLLSRIAIKNSSRVQDEAAKPWRTHSSVLNKFSDKWPPESELHRHPSHFMNITGPANFQFGSYNKAMSGPLGIEQRDLYRDEEIIDFMLSIPLTQLFRNGQTKYIARNASRELMPVNIRLQKRVGLLSEFFNYGVWQKEREWLRERLFDTHCSWDEYVKHDWLEAQFREERPSENAGLVAWQCLTYELWLEKVRELESNKRSMQ
jgi:asparagine synthase (glutamine-hydrolysing)